MASYAEFAQPAWDPIQNAHVLWDIRQNLNGVSGIVYKTYTACMGSWRQPTRHAWDLTQNLHSLYGLLHKTYTT
eukprot:7535161-Pyramimonas_sp.AAC.1